MYWRLSKDIVRSAGSLAVSLAIRPPSGLEIEPVAHVGETTMDGFGVVRSGAQLLLAIIVSLVLPVVIGAQEATPPAFEGRLVASIPLRGQPWRVAIGEGAVWILERGDPAVVRIDPVTNQIRGERIPLPFDPWDLAVGAGAVWVTSNGGDGVVARIDPATSRIVATIGGEPNVLGPYVAFGAGAVWTGNGDERAAGGHTVSRIDPGTNAVVGAPITIRGHAEGIAVGEGAVWVASHDVGELTRIDPATGQVVASIALGSDPHAVAVGERAVWVGLYHEAAVARVDPAINRVVAKIPLGFGGANIAADGSGVWTYPHSEDQPGDDRVARIDPDTNMVTETLHVGAVPWSIAAGAGALWVGVRDPDGLLRLDPRHQSARADDRLPTKGRQSMLRFLAAGPPAEHLPAQRSRPRRSP
jgi:DNA-binding beta-propeller fold protein YncE